MKTRKNLLVKKKKKIKIKKILLVKKKKMKIKKINFL